MHNNARDKQYVYRLRKERQREVATGAHGPGERAGVEAVSGPLSPVLARREREQEVLAELLPEVAAALDGVLEAQRAIADTGAVAAHLTAVDRAATVRVEQADAARAAAEQTAAAAGALAERAARDAAGAVADQDAAYLEAAAALREAAQAAAQVRLAQEELRLLAGEHRAEQAAHQSLAQAHRRLAGDLAAQQAAHEALEQRHTALVERTGRLGGELAVLRPRLAEQTGRAVSLEAELRAAGAELAVARERAAGLEVLLGELAAARAGDEARHTAELAVLRGERDSAVAGLQETGHELARARDTAEVLSGQLATCVAAREADRDRHDEELAALRAGHARTVAALHRSAPAGKDGAPAGKDTLPGGVPGQMDMFPLTSPGEEPERQPLIPAREEGRTAVMTRDGRSWTLGPALEHAEGSLALHADGEEVGILTLAGRGWKAVHRRRTLKPSVGHRFRTQEAAVSAVVDAESLWVPLPGPHDNVYQRISPSLRSLLHSVSSVALDHGPLAEIQPASYRRRLHAAFRAVQCSGEDGQVGGDHLAVLLDASREDLGRNGHAASQRLHDVLQQIRHDLLTQSGTRAPAQRAVPEREG
ncbi:hypothetical protein [Streptomyces griseus]|uniref:hypothetical protein n=1 Tax=Streptomyces griseus TaxID=1911 RepID=UPI0004CAE54D|nr:hypothetical protein [Streptomyces griseus]